MWATRTNVKAVTFDFWNTLMWEEPGSLRQKRLGVWSEVLPELGIAVAPGALESAHDAAHQAYVASWIAGQQFRVEEAVRQMVEGLDGQLPGHAEQVLIEGFSEAGRRAAVHLSGGVGECLRALKAAGVRIGIICDIGLTPSPVITELLERHSLLQFFDSTVFSDEVGHYKPASAIFEYALADLGGIEPNQAVHVGDRRRTDVAGAVAMGMTAVRYNGVYEDESVDLPEAHVVVGDLAKLPVLLCAGEKA